MLSGYATKEGTKKFSSGFTNNYNEFCNLTLSNVGIGTYLGNTDSQTDLLVESAIQKSVLSGINVIDTAINYRAQKAERCVGRIVNEMIKNGVISRDELFISTKNGYVTNDGDIQEGFMQYVIRELGKPGVINEGDISSQYHCMSLKFLEHQLEQSLKNLDLETIDLLYLHNPVEGHPEISHTNFMQNLYEIFEFYEQCRSEKKIRFYGLATWDCFREDPSSSKFLSISEVFNLAKKIGGDNNGFKFIQLPFNLYLDQAFMKKNQDVCGNMMSIFDAAKHYGLGVFTSVPLMQGRLLSPGLIPQISKMSTSCQLLQFIRSTPGILAPLIGQKSDLHVSENMEIMKVLPYSKSEFDTILKKFLQPKN